MLAFFYSISFFSQTEKKIDSLNILYENYQNTNLKKALEYAENAIVLCENSDLKKLVPYDNYIKILYKQRKHHTAKKYVLKLLELANKAGNEKYICLSYLHLSSINLRQNDYDLSLKNIEQAYRIAKLNSFFDLEHEILNKKSTILKNTKNSDKALKILNEILLNEKYTDLINLGYTYNSFGAIYSSMPNKKDSSSFFYKKAINTIKDTNNKYLRTILYFNLGDLLLKTKEAHKGIEYLMKAKSIAFECHNFKMLFSTTISLGIYLDNNKEYSKAIEKYKEAEEKYGKYVEKRTIAHLYWLLSGSLYFNNQYKEGFEYQDKLLLLKDSLFTTEKNKTFEKLQTEYEVEKKNNKITFLEKEQKLEAKQKKLVAGISGLLLVLLGLLVLVFKNKARSEKLIRGKEQKLFLQEKEQLEKDQKIKRIEGYIEGEEKEKNRIAMELHDGIGGQLSGIKHYIASLPNNEKTKVLSENIGLISQEVRILSHSLSTNFSIQQSFNNLLETLKQQYKNHFEIEFVLFPEEEIDNILKEKKLFLYRAIQEILNNAYKHAQANFISLNLTVTDEIVLIIEDNGKGFSTDSTPNGIGLQNIKDKLQSWNGFFEIDSSVNNGTTVIIKLPK